ncbi:MAG: alpha/beta hydrolase [Proteobacteria bacterium]|nr:alpha/beta hydrolase [Pseudomonadota bacterium]
MAAHRATVDGVALAYIEDGAGHGGPPVLCVHGLTRNARDFDSVIATLKPHRRVIAVDVAGRGDSGWLADPTRYNYAVYTQQLLTLLDQLKVDQVDWIGTSMGGLIGMMVAATAPQRIRRFVINDIGPFIPKAALARIAGYIGVSHVWPTIEAAEAHYRKNSAPFGPLTDAQWRHLTETSVRPATGATGFVPAYDPALADAFKAVEPADVDLWSMWAEIRQPILVLRGADSDLLLKPTALGMVARGDVTLREFAGVGHAPALLAADQLDAISRFLST